MIGTVDRHHVGWVALAGFVATVWGANYFVEHVGTEVAPGLHTLPVGFGQEAPSGFVLVGVSLTLRDLVHRLLGPAWTVAGIAVGATLAAAVNTDLAVASGVTFLVAELMDLGVYAPLQRRQLTAAVVASNVVGALADSVLFLWLAFDLDAVREFAVWQALGKLEWGLLFVPLVWLARRRWPQPAGMAQAAA
jgi:uncharacterized PurR-regulated membrane protein YhhQ (DUF165 family)